MSQYKINTVDVTNGSQVVTGNSTLFSANVNVGDAFTVAGTSVIYDVASVDSDTQISLSAPYSGATAAAASYAITRDFTSPDNFPELVIGDIETPTILTRAIRKIQQRFNTPTDITALAAAGIYLTEAAGLADTVDGDFFFVIEGDQYTLYRNDAGSSVEEFVFTGQQELLATLQTIYGLRDETQGYRDETLIAYDDFFGTYYGALATDPATDPLGDPSDDGDFYFNTSNDEVRFYFNGAWGSYGVLVTGAIKADETEARDGVDDTKYMTPLKTNQAIDQSRVKERLEKRASLIMNFAENTYKLISDEGLADSSLSSLLTTTRSSVANRVDHLGLVDEIAIDTPRITYDPVTGECLGLQVGDNATNELLHSEDFTNAAWIKSRTTITANDATAPDGAVTADKFIGNSGTSNNLISQGFTVTSGNDYTLSVFAKADEDAFIRVGLREDYFGGGAATTTYSPVNLTTGAFVKASYIDSMSVEDYGGGWWRIAVTALCTGTSSNIQSILQLAGDGTTTGLPSDYTGDGTSGLHVWGAQLEEGTEPSSYVATTTAATTRDADDISRTLGSEFNADEGTFIVEYIKEIGVPVGRIFNTLNGSNQASLFITQGAAGTITIGAGGTSLSVTASSAADGRNRIAFAYERSAGIEASVNGAATQEDAGTLVRDDVTYNFGSSDGALHMGGTLINYVYYPRRLTSDELQELSAL